MEPYTYTITLSNGVEVRNVFSASMTLAETRSDVATSLRFYLENNSPFVYLHVKDSLSVLVVVAHIVSVHRDQ